MTPITIDELLKELEELTCAAFVAGKHNTEVVSTLYTADGVAAVNARELSKQLSTKLKMIFTPLQVAVFKSGGCVEGVILNRTPAHPVGAIEFSYDHKPTTTGYTQVKLIQPGGGEETVYARRHWISSSDIDLSKLFNEVPELVGKYNHRPGQTVIIVKVKSVCDKHHPLDVDVEGEYPVILDEGEGEEKALDFFHANIPIKVLEDFEITTEVHEEDPDGTNNDADSK